MLIIRAQRIEKQIVNAHKHCDSPLNIFLQSKYPERGRSGYLLVLRKIAVFL